MFYCCLNEALLTIYTPCLLHYYTTRTASLLNVLPVYCTHNYRHFLLVSDIIDYFCAYMFIYLYFYLFIYHIWGFCYMCHVDVRIE